jgi:hypothetical protein
MALNYFDMRDDDQFCPDEQGTELGGGLANHVRHLLTLEALFRS